LIDPVLYLSLIACLGVVVGFLGALLGLGGGFIMVPALILLLGFDAHHAVGTSMVAVIFTGASAALAYHQQGRLDWKLALLAEAATTPGAFAGAVLTSLVSSASLKLLFSILLIILAFSMLLRGERRDDAERLRRRGGGGALSWRRRIGDSRGRIFEYSIDVLKLLPACFLAGIVSGFFGVGGGTVKVPVLYYLGAPMHIAVATSTLMIALTAFSGSLGHLMLGHVKLLELLGLIPGIIAGTRLGAATARRLKSRTLRRIFSSALILIAVLLLIR